jgi:hypothetical protein
MALAVHPTINSVHLRFRFVEIKQDAFDIIAIITGKSDKLKTLAYIPDNDRTGVRFSIRFISLISLFLIALQVA